MIKKGEELIREFKVDENTTVRFYGPPKGFVPGPLPEKDPREGPVWALAYKIMEALDATGADMEGGGDLEKVVYEVLMQEKE